MDEMMLSKPLLSPILDNDALTRGLGDMEARVLIEWLVERAEQAAEQAPNEASTHATVGRLCRRARAIARFVQLWCQRSERGAAHQLAATEGFAWPLPTAPLDPCDLMQWILMWETDQLEH